VESLAADSLRIGHGVTHAIQITANGHGAIPQPVDAGIDPSRTTFLSSPLREWVHQWGNLSLKIMGGIERRQYRYGLIGLEDRSMSPILRPGSLVQIDEERRRITDGAGVVNSTGRSISWNTGAVMPADGARSIAAGWWCSRIRHRKKPPEFSAIPTRLKCWDRLLG